jgi:peptidase M48-like protein
VTPDDMTPEEMKFEGCAGTLSGRYRTLLREVVDRLPNGWDEPRTFTCATEHGSPGYACALRFEEIEDMDPNDLEGHSEQVWAVTFYPELLDKFSDAAVRWVIAHELGHVASGCVCGAIVVDGRAMTRIPGTTDQYREIDAVEKDHNERLANAIARAWGFWSEEQAFRAEKERLGG